MVALLLAVLATAAAAYLFVTKDDTEGGRRAALAAARQYAADLTTYDAASIDADFRRFARHGTAAFQASYAKTIAASKPGIVKAQTRSLGTVVGAGLESYADAKAVVLLAVDQEVRSAARPGSTVDRSRIRLTLARSGNGWLVSAVQVL